MHTFRATRVNSTLFVLTDFSDYSGISKSLWQDKIKCIFSCKKNVESQRIFFLSTISIQIITFKLIEDPS